MTTNIELIENLEESVGGLQDHISRLELGVSDKLHQLEATINKIFEVLLAKHDQLPLMLVNAMNNRLIGEHGNILMLADSCSLREWLSWSSQSMQVMTLLSG